MTDYERIARAIGYLTQHAGDQPHLDEIADFVHLSPYHFQRMFKRWAGITPKQFLQFITVERSKSLLSTSLSLSEISSRVGLSGGSRLYDHFVTLEALTPGEFRHKGEGVNVWHGVHDSPFGQLFIAETERGVCRVSFIDDDNAAFAIRGLKHQWPRARFEKAQEKTADTVRSMFESSGKIRLTVNGTNFQLAVWRALLEIPLGTVVSYSQIADHINRPDAPRAVANAIGANPVAFLIPCHRVIRQSGALGGYRWGLDRKQAMQLWERGHYQSDGVY